MRKTYSKHFNPTCNFQVAISEGKLPLKGEEQNNDYESKSLKILHDYIIKASKESDTLELIHFMERRRKFTFDE